MKRFSLITLFIAFVLSACQPAPEQPLMIVTLIVDGRVFTYDMREPYTVAEFLAQVNVTTSDLDRIVPPPFTQISDGLQVTVRRVTEESYCEERDLPYTRRTVVNEQLAIGTEVLFQAGRNGREQQCYRVQLIDGIRSEPVPVGDPVVLTAPMEEIITTGPTTTLDPVDIQGTLAYVSGANAWVMRVSSDMRRPVTDTGDVDPSRAFSLSPSGRQLLFTRNTAATGTFGNQLSLISDIQAANPQTLDLRPTNILWADWLPDATNKISYTRGEPRATSPGWGASNDLWIITLDVQTGAEIVIDPIIEDSPGRGGPFSWWGRQYVWSPDGKQLAWIHADAVGLVNLETGELGQPLVSYTEFTPRSDWSWRTSVSWSPDSRILLTVTHGAPIGSESAQRSAVFNIDVFAADGGFRATLVERSGIWAYPKFSPAVVPTLPGIAYLQARQPLVSVPDTAEYDLLVADWDGSNARILFPPDGERGITQRDFTWSPDGRQLAVVHQGNLWIVDAISGQAEQVTLDGMASHPVWR